MSSTPPPPQISWSFKDRRHLPTNGSNGAQPEDLSTTLLQMQVDVSMIRDKVNRCLFKIRDSLCLEMDELKHKLEDVRAGQLDMSHMINELENHIFSLQPTYVRTTVHIMAMKNKLCVFTGVFVVIAIVGVVLAANKYF
ncbi:unnamed protein product [Lactuca saligna]|uniref:Uncharacterized protein n=1 Tax=Lactuca saligna TaxID=75948 RepID=A0AA35YX44_LACSI|nr:unnamed protein product [Lactuca saligna]